MATTTSAFLNYAYSAISSHDIVRHRSSVTNKTDRQQRLTFFYFGQHEAIARLKLAVLQRNGTKRSWRRALLTWNENMGDGNNPILHTSHELRIYRGQFDKK